MKVKMKASFPFQVIKFDSKTYNKGMKERTILLAGHSKNYAMTGWRIGYGVFPKDIAAMVTKLVVNSVSSTAQFTQLVSLMIYIVLQI